jgi:hypothetical protein
MPKDKKDEQVMFDAMPGFEADEDLDLKSEDLDLDFLEDDDDDEAPLEPLSDGEDEGRDEGDEGDEEDDESSEEGEETEETDEDGEDGDESSEEGDDEDEKAPKEDKPAKGKKAKEPMVPKSRLDKVLARARKAEQELQAFKSNSEDDDDIDVDDEVEEYDFDAKELEYQELILDGESEKAVQLRREIRAEERKLIQRETSRETKAESQTNLVKAKLMEVAADIESEYPQLDPNSDSFDKELTAEVVDLRDGFISSGKYTAIRALSKAVEMVVRANGLLSVSEEAEAAKDSLKKRKTKSLKEKVADANKQPTHIPGKKTRASNHKAGDDAPIDVMALSDEQFEQLDEQELARLRGDIL